MGCSPSKSARTPKSKPTTSSGTNGETFGNPKGNNRGLFHGPNDLLLNEDVVQTGAAQNAPNPKDADDSDASSVTEKQFFCNTDVSVEWVVQKLCERFKCPVVAAPEWILERLNRYIDKDLDHTLVLRITFGWEDEVLPQSVVLKISSKQAREDRSPVGKLAVKMFKRECNAYEWLQKQKVRVPKIFLIHTTSTEDCSESVIILEDVAERAVGVECEEELSVEAIRDLLRLLAQIHALSRQQKADWSATISPHGAQFYRQLSIFVGNAAAAWTDLGEERLSKLLELTDAKYLARTVDQASRKVEPCLVHGNPIARNFFLTNRREIAALIDWTQVHPGCFGEDVAKAICWNLTPKERQSNLKKLLEFYHYSLLKYSEGAAQDVTIEVVEHAYNHFLPMAAVSYLMFLPEDLKMAAPHLLDRAHSLIDDSLELVAGPTPSAAVLAEVNEEETRVVEMERPEKADDLTHTIVKSEA
ncbi:CHK domain-containing protein [Aphelenchoides fujianensis]|nr:CHK domain-containing protein [Aphelenchoides fujianensis]